MGKKKAAKSGPRPGDQTPQRVDPEQELPNLFEGTHHTWSSIIVLFLRHAALLVEPWKGLCQYHEGLDVEDPNQVFTKVVATIRQAADGSKPAPAQPYPAVNPDAVAAAVLAAMQLKVGSPVDVTMLEVAALPMEYYDTLAALVGSGVVHWDGSDPENSRRLEEGATISLLPDTDNALLPPPHCLPFRLITSAQADGHLAYGSNNGSVFFSSQKHNGKWRELQLCTAPIVGMTWCLSWDKSDGLPSLATLDSTGMLKTWKVTASDAANPGGFEEEHQLQLHPHAPGDFPTAMAGAGRNRLRLAVGWHSGRVTGIEASGSWLLTNSNPTKPVGNPVHAIVAISPHRFVTGHHDGTLRLWFVGHGHTCDTDEDIVPRRSGSAAIPPVGNELEATCATNSSSPVRSLTRNGEVDAQIGLVFAGYQDGTIKGWDMMACTSFHSPDSVERWVTPHRVYKAHSGAVIGLVFDQTGAIVSAGEDMALRVWDQFAHNMQASMLLYSLPAVPSVLSLSTAAPHDDKSEWTTVVHVGLPGNTTTPFVLSLHEGAGDWTKQMFEAPSAARSRTTPSLSQATAMLKRWRELTPEERLKEDWDAGFKRPVTSGPVALTQLKSKSGRSSDWLWYTQEK